MKKEVTRPRSVAVVDGAEWILQPAALRTMKTLFLGPGPAGSLLSFACRAHENEICEICDSENGETILVPSAFFGALYPHAVGPHQPTDLCDGSEAVSLWKSIGSPLRCHRSLLVGWTVIVCRTDLFPIWIGLNPANHRTNWGGARRCWPVWEREHTWSHKPKAIIAQKAWRIYLTSCSRFGANGPARLTYI